MTWMRRRGLPTGLLMLAGLAMSACAASDPATKSGSEAGQRYLALGRELLAANEPALAMRAFTTSLGVEGISAPALTGAGIAAQRQGLLGAARDYFERARDVAPRSVVTHSNLGSVLLALKDYHGARAEFRSALMLSGDADQPALERQLARAELAIAERESTDRMDPAATQRVVRLGSDSFRLTEKTENRSTTTPWAETLTKTSAADEVAPAADRESGEPGTPSQGETANPAPEVLRTGSATGREDPAETGTTVLVAKEIEQGAD